MSFSALGQSAGQMGVGLMLGNPTGLSLKKWRSDTQAIDAGAAWSIVGDKSFSLHSDYLWHNKDALYFQDSTPLDVYYGLGGRMNFDDEIEIGLRIPIGIAHNFAESQSDVFAEIAPVFDFLDTTSLEIQLAFGARYYFN